jgi:hypothetical protein
VVNPCEISDMARVWVKGFQDSKTGIHADRYSKIRIMNTIQAHRCIS